MKRTQTTRTLADKRITAEIEAYNEDHKEELLIYNRETGARKKKLITDGDIAKWLNLSARQLKRYKKDKRWDKISPDVFDILAKRLSVEGQTIRSEYLSGADTRYRTDEELLEFANDTDDNFKNCRVYLNSIGYSVKPYITSSLLVSDIRKHWRKMKPYISPDRHAYYERIFQDKDYEGIFEDVTWESCPDVTEKDIYRTDVPGTSDTPNAMGKMFFKATESYFHIDINYTVRLSISKNGKYVTTVDISTFKSFAEKMRSVAESLTDNFLLSR